MDLYRLFLLTCERITQPELVARFVVLALDRVPRAAVVKSEYFIGEIQSRDRELQTTVHAEAGLRVHLGVLVQIRVSARPFDSQGHG